MISTTTRRRCSTAGVRPYAFSGAQVDLGCGRVADLIRPEDVDMLSRTLDQVIGDGERGYFADLLLRIRHVATIAMLLHGILEKERECISH